MNEEQIKHFEQAQEWTDELNEIRKRVDRFASKFSLSKGLSATFIARTTSSVYYALGQIEYRDLRQAAEDNADD